MKLLFSLLTFAILMTSCEGNTTRTRQIENNTSGDILVTANGESVSNFDQVISANATEGFFITQQRGGSDYVEDPVIGVNELVIINAAGDTCTKDFTLQSNWAINVVEKSKVPSDWRHTYTFIVNDSDF